MSLNDAVETMSEIPVFRNVDPKRLKLFALMGTMFNARTAATLSALRAENFADVLKIEQDFARDAFEKLNDGVRELGELRYNVAREASEPFTARAREVAETLKTEKAA